MRRIFTFFVAGVLVLSIVGPMGMGSAIAQDGDNETTGDQGELEADAMSNETEAIESAAIVEDRNQSIQFGEWAELLGWGFEDGRVQLVIRTERPTEIVVSDGMAGIGKEGAVSVPQHEESLQAGTHVVTMPVETFRGGHSVGVAIDDAQVRLSSEMREDEPDDPLQYFGGMSGLFWGIGMTTGLAGAAAAYVVYREDSGVIKA
ncbi:hypothetical protein HALLA_17505 [Halostagnicola larsenii XH-48]|uniref:Uncharacterized protein n=1 Tax=Halostagnicola larsenii XH-48 TaxID=797299 RepID=W0JSS4_9EURY|nr:hypothetical protein [Halostagnicola larsenii]AHG00327.1 hypothetical protein HALLA_17505 [Halostagnicola larsenii XH-48]